MTCRHLFEKRLGMIRGIAFTGFVLYLIPLPGMPLSPWFTALSGMGLLLCMVAAAGAFLALRCTECGTPMVQLLTVTHDRRLVAIRADVAECPHCGFDFDSHHDNSGMPEILSAHERDTDFVGVVEVSSGGTATRYELSLNGKSKDAILRILRMTPFRNADPGSYRYFYMPRGQQPARHRSSMAILRVEKGDRMQNIEFPMPPELMRAFEFLRDLDTSDQIVAVRRSYQTSKVEVAAVDCRTNVDDALVRHPIPVTQDVAPALH